MNKPTWDDAPEWANWLAQDFDGEWWWYEHEPVQSPLGCWVNSIYGYNELAARADVTYWRESLEQRPG